MNTRLQVEHPVTEAICGGLDLVELQLRVAAGERLVVDAAELGPYGHAIEARVYAEDPYAGSSRKPASRLLVRWPEGGGSGSIRRWRSGQEVTTAYDPMLGKIIAAGPDREIGAAATRRCPGPDGDPRSDHQRRLSARGGGRTRVRGGRDRRGLAGPGCPGAAVGERGSDAGRLADGRAPCAVRIPAARSGPTAGAWRRRRRRCSSSSTGCSAWTWRRAGWSARTVSGRSLRCRPA